MQPVYLVCGVPGSGKSWVCEQLEGEFSYLKHDEWLDTPKEKRIYANAILKLAKTSEKPVLADCPFGERPLKEDLERLGLKVTPIFIVEMPMVIAKRYSLRKKPIPKAHMTRALSIKNRAKEWNAFFGTSQEVLYYLRNSQPTN